MSHVNTLRIKGWTQESYARYANAVEKIGWTSKKWFSKMCKSAKSEEDKCL